LLSEGRGPSVQRQSLVRFRRPATGVSGQESLSSSEEEESRFSPVRGDLGRGELSAEDDVLMRESWRGDMLVSERVLEGFRLSDGCEVEASESVVDAVDAVDASEERVETDDSMSEWARVYLVVVISSSSGVRNETRFSAGNMGRWEPILRGIIERAGLLERIEARLWGCL
jgi:hypothetical protein